MRERSSRKRQRSPGMETILSLRSQTPNAPVARDRGDEVRAYLVHLADETYA